MPSGSISTKYKNLVTADLIAHRLTMYQDILTYLENDLLPSGVEIIYSTHKLTNLAYSYFYDVYRYKDFHQQPDATGKIPLVNTNKIAAFSCKWISRTKPLSVVFDPTVQLEEKEKYYYANLINSMFCVALISHVTKKEVSDFIKSNFLYNMHYGSPDENSLIIFFDELIK